MDVESGEGHGHGGGSRQARDLSVSEIRDVLQTARWGVLATAMDGEPYAVPVVFALDGDHLVVVSSPGRKVSALEANPRVCFTIPEVHDNGARWRSVVAIGSAEFVEDALGRVRVLDALRKHQRGSLRPGAKDAARLLRARFIRIRVESLTGRAVGF